MICFVEQTVGTKLGKETWEILLEAMHFRIGSSENVILRELHLSEMLLGQIF